MTLCKKIIGLNTNLKIKKEKNNIRVTFTNSQKLLISLKVPENFILHDNSIILFNNKLKEFNYSGFLNVVLKNLSTLVYGYYSQFSKLYMIGLGFKNFVLGQKLYILVGDCNYLIFNIPDSIKVFCRKNQIYLLGIDTTQIFNFMSNIKKIKKSNFYKGKGVLEFKNFKFTKLKVGKKQRFM